MGFVLLAINLLLVLFGLWVALSIVDALKRSADAQERLVTKVEEIVARLGRGDENRT